MDFVIVRCNCRFSALISFFSDLTQLEQGHGHARCRMHSLSRPDRKCESQKLMIPGDSGKEWRFHWFHWPEATDILYGTSLVIVTFGFLEVVRAPVESWWRNYRWPCHFRRCDGKTLEEEKTSNSRRPLGLFSVDGTLFLSFFPLFPLFLFFLPKYFNCPHIQKCSGYSWKSRNRKISEY